MLYAIHFQDTSGFDPDLRTKMMRQHLAFLRSHKDFIRAAGPLREEDGQIQSGLWLVEVESAAQAWDLVTADPFWPTGLRGRVKITQWVQVFAEGQALV